MNNEKYNIIVNCTLKGIKGLGNEFRNSYVLIKDIQDLDNELNVDLKGLCFNTDYKITNVKKYI